MLHVDDLLFTGNTYAHEVPNQCLSSLTHSPIQLLAVGQNLTFRGVDISMNEDASISLPQEPFYSKLSEIKVSDAIKGDQLLLKPEASSKILKSFVGCFIWLFKQDTTSSSKFVILLPM